MDAERVGSIGDAFLVAGKCFLNIQLFELLQSFVEHDVTIEHLFDHCFQSGAYLHRISLTTKSKLETIADEQLISFEVTIGRGLLYLSCPPWRRRLFVPIKTFEIVANVLFVERRLPLAYLVPVDRPE